MSSVITTGPGLTSILDFCCVELSLGAIGSTNTDIALQADGNYAVKLSTEIYVSGGATDFTSHGTLSVVFLDSNGSVYGQIGAPVPIIGEGKFEINSHIVPLRAGDSIRALLTNTGSVDLNSFDRYFEAAWRSVYSPSSGCSGGGGG